MDLFTESSSSGFAFFPSLLDFSIHSVNKAAGRMMASYHLILYKGEAAFKSDLSLFNKRV
jgi:hypothetical protein